MQNQILPRMRPIEDFFGFPVKRSFKKTSEDVPNLGIDRQISKLLIGHLYRPLAFPELCREPGTLTPDLGEMVSETHLRRWQMIKLDNFTIGAKSGLSHYQGVDAVAAAVRSSSF